MYQMGLVAELFGSKCSLAGSQAVQSGYPSRTTHAVPAMWGSGMLLW